MGYCRPSGYKAVSFNSIQGIQKVRTVLPVLTSSNLPWLGVCVWNQTFGDDEDCNITEIQQLLNGDDGIVEIDQC